MPGGVILQAEDRRDPAPAAAAARGRQPPRCGLSAALGAGPHCRPPRRRGVDWLPCCSDPVAGVRATAAFALGLLGEASVLRGPGWSARRSGRRRPCTRRRGRRAHRGAGGRGAARAPHCATRARKWPPLALLRAWRLQDATLVAPRAGGRGGGQIPAGGQQPPTVVMRMVGPPNTGATPVPGGTDMSAATRHRAAQVLVALATDERSSASASWRRAAWEATACPAPRRPCCCCCPIRPGSVRVNAVRSLGPAGRRLRPGGAGAGPRRTPTSMCAWLPCRRWGPCRRRRP